MTHVSECQHCEYYRRINVDPDGGWVYFGNNGPYVACGVCNADGKITPLGLDDEELITIETCVKNDQRGRITAWELLELVRGYREYREHRRYKAPNLNCRCAPIERDDEAVHASQEE